MSREKEDILLNQDINFNEVRCIGDDGEIYGIISSQQAQSIANSKGLDLVLISRNSNPPVCKVMDYGKYRYRMEKRQKEARKKQSQIEIKEIKLSTQIAQNDINYKVRHARDFILENKHVRFKVFLRGRESSDPQAGFGVLQKIREMMVDVAVLDKEPRVEGRFLVCLFVPKKVK